MRYSLRNQHKIKQALSEKHLKRILSSLDEAFKNDGPEPKEMHGEDYKVIDINDNGHSCGLILFYVIRKTYDVYNLAFKEFVN
jgi:hypothetical protein